ncbi:MAG TPA: hypothetical protein VJ867_17745 [Gemmatimonadaceae bacterium]|nr:hypothetical protein [Gemmatimonadaceae bacterium]
MAVREFVDEDGREWRAWDIKPEEIHPVTRAEDYLADCFITGWIVFETRSGDEKRRLCPWPTNWAERSDDDLRELLRRAERISPFRVRDDRVSREQPVPTHGELDIAGRVPDVTDLDVIRTFKYPGGRVWTVCVVAYPEHGGPPVLRFQSGLRIIDVRKWSKDWPDQPDDELVWILRRAAPRRRNTPVPSDAPRRRWDDEQSATT